MKTISKLLVLATLTSSLTAQALTRSQHDTAVGAVLGGIAGAVVGNDATSAVAGAALGGVVGSQWNAHKEEKKQRERDYREYRRHRQEAAYYPEHRGHHHKHRHPHRHHHHGGWY